MSAPHLSGLISVAIIVAAWFPAKYLFWRWRVPFYLALFDCIVVISLAMLALGGLMGWL